jgi:branched-chain amino acid transport system substrate-binding protein
MIMSATATSPELVTVFNVNTDGLLWRTAPPDTLQGRVLANLLLTDPTYMTAAKIGIVYVNDAYGSGLQAELSRRLTSKMVVTAPFESGMDSSITTAVGALAPMSGTPVNATVVIGVTSDTKKILQAAFARPELLRAAGHRWASRTRPRTPTS